MPTLVTLLFQGKVESHGPLDSHEEREVVHAAFPLSPPRDATSRQDFRAWKIVPLTSGRLLLTAILNRGEQDDYGRPVLRAHGCLLAASEMTGALRDPSAVWEALQDDPGEDASTFAERVAERSIHSSTQAFESFRSELARAGAFHAQVADALTEETADLYLGDPARALEFLRPALGLLPLEKLRRLHLAVGGEDAGAREPILALPGRAPDSWREGGLLSGLFGRKKDDGSEAAVDFSSEEVFGTRGQGPAELAAAISDPEPWSESQDHKERYSVLLQCLDAGGSRTPFDVVPVLDRMRRTVQRLEQLSKELKRWP